MEAGVHDKSIGVEVDEDEDLEGDLNTNGHNGHHVTDVELPRTEEVLLQRTHNLQGSRQSVFEDED